jgi:hypothetical protein
MKFGDFLFLKIEIGWLQLRISRKYSLFVILKSNAPIGKNLTPIHARS